jgi:hypothetical protein
MGNAVGINRRQRDVASEGLELGDEVFGVAFGVAALEAVAGAISSAPSFELDTRPTGLTCPRVGARDHANKVRVTPSGVARDVGGWDGARWST